MNNKQILIIPDVHGRTFWKEAINKFPKNEFPNMEIIFLGDYIDPYPREKITPESALKRFKRIIKLKKKYPERITLLIGNHDFHYIDGSRRGCRMDYYNKDEICSLFINY